MGLPEQTAFFIDVDTWTHVAITRVGNTYNFYKDGVLQTQGVDTNPNLPTSIGWQAAGRSHDYFGNLDEIRLSDGALAPEEFLIALGAEPPTPITIDIKPGSDPNSVQLKSRGALPVAILSTDEFDALDVDPASLLFGDPLLIGGVNSPVAPLRFSEEDVTGDGLDDLILKFSIQEMIANGVLGPVTEEGLLTGSTIGGTEIFGSDSIRVLSNTKAAPEPSSMIIMALALYGYSCLAVSANRRCRPHRR